MILLRELSVILRFQTAFQPAGTLGGGGPGGGAKSLMLALVLVVILEDVRQSRAWNRTIRWTRRYMK